MIFIHRSIDIKLAYIFVVCCFILAHINQMLYVKKSQKFDKKIIIFSFKSKKVCEEDLILGIKSISFERYLFGLQ